MKGFSAFVVAMRCEADAVRPCLRSGDRLVVCGVGKVNAAAAAQRAICEGASEVWNVGVAGGFGRGMRVGDCFAIDRAAEYDFDLSEVNGTPVGTLDGRSSPFFPCAADFAPGLRRATLATGDRFGDGAACGGGRDAATLAALGATVRDMEGAAVAHVCEANGVPCRILKAISDVHGRGSMVGQYAEFRGKALSALAAALREALRPQSGADRAAGTSAGRCEVEVAGSLPRSVGLSRSALRRAAALFAAQSARRVGERFRSVAVVLQGDAASAEVHLAVNGAEGPTDVITQRYDAMPGEGPGVYGELYVNCDRALLAAPRRRGWSAAKELLLYVAHGMDHLSGADDLEPSDRDRMRRRELRWLRLAQDAAAGI